MTQRTVVVLVAAAVMFAAAVAGQADDALRWRIKQLQAELNQLRAQAATHAQLEADLENERRQKDAARQSLASVQEQLRDAQASLVQAQDREAALQQDLAQAQGRYGVVAQVLSSTQQRLAEARALSAQLPGARQALSSAQDELAGTQAALAAEQERHRDTRGILSGVRQALEQASAAVVKLRFAQNRQNRQNAAAQAELQADLLEAQQRQWQAEQDAVSLRQELSQANALAQACRRRLPAPKVKPVTRRNRWPRCGRRWQTSEWSWRRSAAATALPRRCCRARSRRWRKPVRGRRSCSRNWTA